MTVQPLAAPSPEPTASGFPGPGFSVPGVRLAGVVGAVPRRRLENADFEARFGAEAVRDVAKMLGVQTRHWVEPGQTTADLCHAAAERLLDRLDWARESLDALILVTQTPDQRLPATACVLHARLGLAPHTQAFDVALGCSGYVYGLWLASSLISAGCTRVLLLVGDTSSLLLDPDDRGTALLFGDAGSATALERRAEAPAIHFVLGADGAGAANLIVPAGGFRPPAPDARRPPDFDPQHLYMDGGEVFAFTLRAVPRLVRDTLARAGRTVAEVDAVVLHQANRFMLNHLAKKIGATPAQVPINIDRFGNTSSATIPLVLAADLAPRLKAGPASLVCAGFGVGYSWGGAFVETDGLGCAEMVEA